MLQLLLADDDKDDCFFFQKALQELPYPTQLDIVRDGEQLLKHLSSRYHDLPDLLFLDLNMPRKNGSECLLEIKAHPHLKQLPVIIYSTSLNEDDADSLYNCGAHFYIRKCDFLELIKLLQNVLGMFTENKFGRPSRKGFVMEMVVA